MKKGSVIKILKIREAKKPTNPCVNMNFGQSYY